MDGILVRTAEHGDLPPLTDLYNHYVKTSPATFDLEPVSLDSRRQWMSRYADTGPHRLLVAIDEGAIAGYATSGRLPPLGRDDRVCASRSPRT
jgi:phosphinothricin acetyltransferase